MPLDGSGLDIGVQAGLDDAGAEHGGLIVQEQGFILRLISQVGHLLPLPLQVAVADARVAAGREVERAHVRVSPPALLEHAVEVGAQPERGAEQVQLPEGAGGEHRGDRRRIESGFC